MIGKMELNILNKNMTIDYLTKQLVTLNSLSSNKRESSANDMIMFDI